MYSAHCVCVWSPSINLITISHDCHMMHTCVSLSIISLRLSECSRLSTVDMASALASVMKVVTDTVSSVSCEV